MKKFLLISGVITLFLACNVIYAKQLNCPQEICNLENCMQTQTHFYNNCEQYNCYVEGCTETRQHFHNNYVEHCNGNRLNSTNAKHNRCIRHH